MEEIGSKETNVYGVFVEWVFPKRPSKRARKLIEELNRQGMQWGLDGPAIEYRVHKIPKPGSLSRSYWLDISFFLSHGIKLNIEVDDEHHDSPEQKKRDWERDKYLESRGWIIIRIHHSRMDNEPIEKIAQEILHHVIGLEFEAQLQRP